MSVTKEVTMMIGTEGGYDYAVVDNKDGINLGVKPVVEDAGFGAMALGVRVRAASDGTMSMTHVGESAKAAYPDIEWGKVDSSRASLWRGNGGPIPTESSEEFVKVLEANDFFEDINKFVESLLGESHHSQMNKDELSAWMKTQYVGHFQAMLDGKVPVKDGEEPAEPTKVLPFSMPDGEKTTKH